MTKLKDDQLAEQYINSDGTRQFSADQSMGGNRLKNVADPVEDGDAVNKKYLENFIPGDLNPNLFLDYYPNAGDAIDANPNPVQGQWCFLGVGDGTPEIGWFWDFGNVYYEEDDINEENPIPLIELFTINISDNLKKGVPISFFLGGLVGSYTFSTQGFRFAGNLYGDGPGFLGLDKDGLFISRSFSGSDQRALRIQFPNPEVFTENQDVVSEFPNEEGLLASRLWVNSKLKYSLVKSSTESFSGATSPTILDFLEIPGGSLANNKQYSFLTNYFKNNTAPNEILLFVNTSNSLTGATQIGRYLTTSAGRFFNFERVFQVVEGQIRTSPAGTINLLSNRGNLSSNVVTDLISVDLSNDIFLIVACANSDTATISRLECLSIYEL